MSRTTSSRVAIPSNPEAFLKLAAAIFAKHTADGKTSPMSQIKRDNQTWADVGKLATAGLAEEGQITDLERKLAELYASRDMKIAKLKPFVTTTRDLLTALNKDNRKVLGQWGFTVQDSAAPAPPSKKAAKA